MLHHRHWLIRFRNRLTDFELWLACYSTDEIASECNCGKATVSEVCSEKFSETISNKPAANHAADFDTPIYNVWNQQVKTPGSTHFGNTEVKILDNLFYLYTKPLDIVIDPFAADSLPKVSRNAQTIYTLPRMDAGVFIGAA